VLVIHWTGADGNTLLSKNYIEALFAPGRPLDATRYFLIFPDNVGHGKSSKPSDELKARFPKYGYRDVVDLQHRLVTETLGIEHLHAILGMSMGGMNAWQWAEAYPDAMDGVMPVVSMPIPISGGNMLWRRIVIDAIRSDPQWNGGNYTLPERFSVNADDARRRATSANCCARRASNGSIHRRSTASGRRGRRQRHSLLT
jgi:homoserine O-acetyltransferase/O-succinyltransferase